MDPGIEALNVAKQYLKDVHSQDLVAAHIWLERAMAYGNAEAAQLMREYELAESPPDTAAGSRGFSGGKTVADRPTAKE